MYRKILVPLDGSPLAEEILKPAGELGRQLGAELLLLRVIEPAVLDRFPLADDASGLWGQALLKSLDEQDTAVRQEAEAYLEGLARRLRLEGSTVQSRVVCRESPSAAILEQVRAETADLIALATHGRRGIARLFLGSVAEQVLREAPVPVLLLRPVPHAAAEPPRKHADPLAV